MSRLDFDSAMDAFSGFGSVGYLMKPMGKRVTSCDFLNFPKVVARATVENNVIQLAPNEVELLQKPELRQDFTHPYAKNVRASQGRFATVES